MHEVPNRAGWIVWLGEGLRWLGTGVLGVVLAVQFTGGLVLPALAFLVYPLTYIVGRWAWIGFAALLYVRKRGLAGVAKEVASTVGYIKDETVRAMKEAQPMDTGWRAHDPIPPDEELPPGAWVFVLVHGLGAALAGALLWLFSDAGFGAVVGTFAGVGVVLGLVLVALLRGGFLHLFFDIGYGDASVDIDYSPSKHGDREPAPPPLPPTE